MLALGIRGDQPVDPEQPPLVDGIHLRWAPDQDLGFPWGGFYLFRRESTPSHRVCLSPHLERLKPGAPQTTLIKTRVGQLSSPKPLVFTDDFAPAGVVEVDLRAPVRFDLPPGITARQASVRIGFRADEVTRTCVDFRQSPLGSGPNPRTEKGAVFTVEPLLTPPAAQSSIAQVSGSPHGLQGVSRFESSVRIHVVLPCPASRVDLTVTNPTETKVEGFDAAGVSAGVQTFAAHALSAGAVRVSGKAIKRITIESAGTESALIHQICWDCPAAAASGRSIDINFDQWTTDGRPNPLIEQDVRFFSTDAKTPLPQTLFVKTTNGITGLRAPTVDIDFPCATTSVSMLFSGGGSKIHVDAFNEDGTVAQSADLLAGSPVFTGTAIKRLHVEMAGQALLHHLSFQCGGTTVTPIDVTATSGPFQVLGERAQGAPGEVVSVPLNFTGNGFDGITVSAGNAALIDICYLPNGLTDTFGWQTVAQFQYPLSLPVADADYPCPSKPATPANAATLAFSRVTYHAPQGWDQQFPRLHDELVALVHGGPQAGAMATREHAVLNGQPLSPATQESPTIPNLRPLELVLLASLHPAMAQMLGLYFADQTAQPNIAYDYLLLADHHIVLGGTAESALDWLAFAPNHDQVDMVRADNQTAAPRPAIAPPPAPRAYALPAMAVRAIDGTVQNGIGAAGLWWQLPPDSNQPQPDRILFYYPRRAFLGTATPAAQPALADYNVRLQPILVSEPDPTNPPVTPQRSSEWPPPSIPIYTVDGSLPEGWYSYRLSGQDLFGRRSALGPPSEWYQWDPLQAVHPYAVALLDKIPPPLPLGVEAWALDPLDRWLPQDQPYKDWRASVPSNRVGLRVRWRWTLMQQLQAPDTTEFRIYYQPGRWNALLGNVHAVSAASATQSDVDLDFADARGANAFAGARLRVGNDDFAVISSQPGAKLRLRVQNIGPHDEVRPAAGRPCTIAIPEGHALFVDTKVPKSWARRLAHVAYDPPARTVFDVAFEDAAATAPVSGATIQLPASVDLSVIQPWIDHVRLGGAFYPIVRFDAAAHTVTLASAPPVSSPQAWAIGRPEREYDVFLDAPDVGAGQRFEPSLAEPAVFAQIAVSAADDKLHVADTFPGEARVGNESRLSPSATVYRVLQTPPAAPELPDLPARLFATPADYHDRSYSTFRFVAAPSLRIHILRALDDALFQRDWLVRETRKTLDPTTHADYFPDAMDAAARSAAAAVLNAITPTTNYSTLPQDALNVLALLPGNENALDLATRDRAIRASLATPPSFPSTWNQPTRDAATTALAAIASPTDYASLPDNALRILAALPGNEAAFTQVTLHPFEMSDPAIADERRPDDADGYTAQPAVRAYTDTLPGRATNRYFYRAMFVDGAQNQSALSLPGAPVYLRKVEGPRAPVITKVIGGERNIAIRWITGRNEDVQEYRVYRSEDSLTSSDVRSMTLVHTEHAIAPTPSGSPRSWEWIDANVPARSAFYYRITIVDGNGNVSRPSSAHPGRAYDITPPAPPTWVAATWEHIDPAGAIHAWTEKPPPGETWKDVIVLDWSSAEPVEVLIQRRRQARPTIWEIASAFLPISQTRFVDVAVLRDQVHTYRLVGRSAAGNVSEASDPLEVPFPI